MSKTPPLRRRSSCGSAAFSTSARSRCGRDRRGAIALVFLRVLCPVAKKKRIALTLAPPSSSFSALSRTMQLHILGCVRELKTNPIGPDSVGADAVADVRAALTTLTRRAAAFESNVADLGAQQREVEAQIDAALAGSPANSPARAAPAAEAFCVGAAVTAPWQGKTALFPGELILFTVTFRANPAHDLTCSPSYIIFIFE